MVNSLRLLVTLALLTLCTQSAFAFLPPRAGNDGHIPLPGEGLAVETPPPAAGHAKAPGWSSFTQRHPGWESTFHRTAGTPHRAFGSGIPVTGPVTSAEQAAEAAERFLRQEAPLTKAGPVVDLELAKAIKAQRVWYVHFRQLHEGIPLLETDVTVRLGEDGKVFAFGSDIRSDIALDARPRLSAADAQSHAVEGLHFDPNRDSIEGGEQLFVLPLESEVGTRYALVREVLVRQANPPHAWVTMVDAHTGEVVWRFDTVRYGSVSGTKTILVHPEVPSDPLTELPARSMYVNVDGVDVTTDELGAYLAESVTGSVDLTFQIRGPFGQAFRADNKPNAFEVITVDADTDPVVDHIWDNDNSQSNERDAFFSAERTHEYIKSIDPDFTTIDYQMPINVLIDATCNAFWDGESINFFKAGDGCNSTAKLADVVAHEYGHGINDLLYQQAGGGRMFSGALHEGMADVTAAFLFDDPVIGDEFTGNGEDRYLRNVDNTNSLPLDLVGQVHTDGQIIAGAFWDLREAIGLAEAGRLAHFAKYGLPDHGQNQRVAFREYLLETLVADDDDSDLSNGTPHWNEIIDSFALHGITRALYVDLRHDNTPDVTHTEAVTVQALISSTESADFPLDPTRVQLVYRVDRGPWTEVPMEQLSVLTWSADIPGQEAGSVVTYHFLAAVQGGETRMVPLDPDVRGYQYIVGEGKQIYFDSFESDKGWTVGGLDDDATTGVWQRATPEGTSNHSQPGRDHTANGTRCYVTGPLAGENAGDYDVDGGQTTLTSPVFDLSSEGPKVIRYWRIFDNNLGRYPGQPLPDDPWIVEISNDGGETWETVENTLVSDIPSGRPASGTYTDWRRYAFRVDRFITPTDQMQLRFIAQDTGNSSLVEALLDDFEILGYSTIVPVLLSRFSIEERENDVAVRWTAEGDGARSEFRVRASASGSTWDVAVTEVAPGTYEAVDRDAYGRVEKLVTYSLFFRAAGGSWDLLHEEQRALQSTPLRVELHEPWPNPFNPRTTVSFSVDQAQRVRLAVYDLAGREVTVLADRRFESGAHQVNWEGMDDAGRAVSSGVYFLRMQTASFRDARKLVLVR